MGRKKKKLEYGYKYKIPPFEGYEEYNIAIPLKEDDGSKFGWCYIMTNRGKKSPMFQDGMCPISIDICSDRSKLAVSVMKKLFKDEENES